MNAVIDIVIPVWNHPVETRDCLVNLMNHTPGARFILVDHGSERETERMLQEIADGLDDRALLLRDDHNLGFVRAANRGLARSEAPYVALVRHTTVVSPGWIDPILEFAAARPEAGVLLPCTAGDARAGDRPIEVESGSFAAMVLTRETYRAVGGFDEGLDGGAWCLKDFTRRACAAGLFTFLVPASSVTSSEEVQLGSLKRREEALERSIRTFRGRWGEGRGYCVHVPSGVDVALLSQKLEVLVKGARHGDRFRVFLPAKLARQAESAGLASLHENVRLVHLPRLSGDAGRRRLYERICLEERAAEAVSAVDGIPFPWSESYLPFTALCDRILAGYR